MLPRSSAKLAYRRTPGEHAWVVVVSLHGALHVKEFFRLGRAMRVGCGGGAHLFVIYGLCLLKPRCAALLNQLCLWVILMRIPSVIPSLAKSMADGAWIDVEKAFATGGGVPPSPTCQFQ